MTTLWQNTHDRYGRISKLLHWLMAFGLIGMLVLGLLLDSIPGMWKPTAFSIHKSLGITLLALAVVRLGWRLMHVQPRLPQTIARMQALASRATHWLLYGLMLAMPLSGWAMSSGFGVPVKLWGMTIPALLEKDRALGMLFKEAHELIGYSLMAVIALHTAAALYHHFICKDHVLKRMLPFSDKRNGYSD
jgi:cytochrome b561